MTFLQVSGEMPSNEIVQWADGFVLVYSITDRQSFSFIKQVKQYLAEKRTVGGAGAQPKEGGSPSTSTPSLPFSTSFSFPSSPSNAAPLPIAIIGNKGDMVHLRQVSTDEGEFIIKKLYSFCGVLKTRSKGGLFHDVHVVHVSKSDRLLLQTTQRDVCNMFKSSMKSSRVI
jgi:hypothetical protein